MSTDTFLAGHPDIAESALVRAGGRDILAVVPVGHAAAADLRDELWDTVPADGRPDAVVVVFELPADSESLVDEPGLCDFSEPTTPTQTALVEVWRDVLGRRHVAVGDNFLDLGGDSMSAVLLLDLTNERFGTDLTFDELLAWPSLRDVAAAIDERR